MSDERSIDPQEAVDFIFRTAPAYAKAKAERIYLEEYRKTKKAILMKEAEGAASKHQRRRRCMRTPMIGTSNCLMGFALPLRAKKRRVGR